MEEQEQVIIPTPNEQENRTGGADLLATTEANDGTGKKPRKPRKEYPKLETLDDIPESRNQLSYEWMLNYTLAEGTPEQCAEMLDFIEHNQIQRESHLERCKGVTFYVTDIRGMRNLFCDMFFPALKEYKSKPTEETQLEKAKRLLAEKAAQARAAKEQTPVKPQGKGASSNRSKK